MILLEFFSYDILPLAFHFLSLHLFLECVHDLAFPLLISLNLVTNIVSQQIIKYMKETMLSNLICKNNRFGFLTK